MDLNKEIDEYLDKQESQIRQRDYFYVSEVGKSKKEIYKALKSPEKKKFEARVKRILENGDYMHSRYYKYFAEMGILRATEIKAVETDLLHGRADCLVSDKEGKLWLVDLKSMSQWSFNKLTAPSNEHKLQLLVYMYFMKIEQGILLYECKDNQTIKTFKLLLDDNNKKLVEKIIEELTKLKEDIKNSLEPEDKPISLEDLEVGI